MITRIKHHLQPEEAHRARDLSIGLREGLDHPPWVR